MKRVINLIIILVLLSSLVVAQSAIASLKLGESKSFVFGPGTYEIKLIEFDIKNKQAKFSMGDFKTGLLSTGEAHKFSSGITISVVDFFELQGPNAVPRVKFLVEIPTTSCGTARCYPGERCVDIEYCYPNTGCSSKKGCETYCGNGYCDNDEIDSCPEDCSICGNGKCEGNEHCGTCLEDCKCNTGFSCVDDSCLKKETIEIVEIYEEQPAKIGFFQSILNWLKGVFFK